MKLKLKRTICAVKLKKSIHKKDDFYLLVESYPIYEEGSTKPQRKYVSLNSIITTPVWDKERTTRGGIATQSETPKE
jgi:hypothetical protein